MRGWLRECIKMAGFIVLVGVGAMVWFTIVLAIVWALWPWGT